MRCFAPARMLTRVSLVACLMIASASGLAWAQSGTLQAPAHKPAAAAPAKPAAPARPAAPQPATPVVQPHGPVHPTKPPEERHPHTSLPLPPPDPFASPPATPPATAAAPAKPEEQEKPVGTGLPLPRFAALRSDDVNLRAGPGFRYPIEWVYKRRDLPMEIEREFEVWRLVVAPDGIRGWIHQATLTGLRTFMVQGADATLRAEPRDDAAAVAILKVGVIGRIRSCQVGSDWCRLQVGDYRGFLKRSQFWGTLPDEVLAP
jgi:SH3-like domain-containing protein